MLTRPTPDARAAETLLVCLQADGRAGLLARQAGRLAQALACEWSVAVFGPHGAEVDAALHAARQAGAALLPVERSVATGWSAGEVRNTGHADRPRSGLVRRARSIVSRCPGPGTPAGATAEAMAGLARRVRATTVMTGAPTDPSEIEGFARALALPGVTLHLIGAEKIGIQAASALRSRLREAWRDAPAVVAALMLCTLVGSLLQGAYEPSNLIMVYLAGVVYIALKRSQPAALMTVAGSVLLYDVIFVVRPQPASSGLQSHLLVSLVMMLVGVLISHLADQVRAQAAAAETRERRTQAQNRLALALAQARTTESIGRALAQAVHRSLQASATLRPVQGGDRPDEPDHGTPVDAAPGRLDVPLRAGDQLLGALEVELLTGEHDTPEGHLLLKAFASQGAVALERAVFEKRSADVAIEAERERLRNTLLAGVSHDFRTPLTTIVGSTTSLLEQSHAIDPQQRTALLQGVLSEARRLHTMTSNLLDLARLQEGAIRPSLEWCPADELVDEARAAMATVIGGRDLRVRVDTDLAVWCDPRLLGQALGNLLDNAARHAGPGARIAVDVSAIAGHWVLRVEDDGPGIPPGLEQEVFKKFFRGPPAVDRPGAGAAGGTGLGLAICAAVVELHGGTIAASPGPGGRFELVLPQPVPQRAV